MQVIVFAATKGGTGKTTITYNVAIEAAKKHNVFIADLDPQASLRKMWERLDDQTNPHLVSNMQDPAQSIKLLREAGYDREYIFIDTPGSMISVIRKAVLCANCVVLPVQPSPVDWLAQEAMADMVEDLGVADRSLFVMNRSEARDPMAAQTREFFATRTKHPIGTIRRRPEYAAGFESGDSGVDLSKEAGKEIRDLWSAIKEVLETGKSASKRPGPAPPRAGGRIYDRDRR